MLGVAKAQSIAKAPGVVKAPGAVAVTRVEPCLLYLLPKRNKKVIKR